ncbi:SDR family oxidoreductase [Deinococcus sp. Marseille-Q6407]|uniref:SDR family oxidoreductase n=1 Tax=Deinococcus sp. Marseille-Q6407 TaxID=2969223 RepID=UPI0021BE193B|nr:SDR family oxidoreductase [Deinococcus sp. Marseille-Q6407]
MNLQDARILVTGSTSGIGLAIARRLHEGGARVVLAGRDDAKIAALRAEGWHVVQADVSRDEDAVRLVREAAEHLGGLDVLVNNAGGGRYAPLLEQDTAEFRQMLDTNLVGATVVAREAARLMVQNGGGQGHGTIINIGSVSGLRGSAGAGAYSATKFGLRGLTQSWRDELRPKNIRVSYVAPSEVITGFGGSDPASRKNADRKIQPEDMAHAVAALIEMDDRAFVTELEVFATNPW